ncbi:MAG TPA: sigma-70 family RNA polymerase sigma factor [Kofleriaceae bacterium]|nr:sigma-70 family RNA polymerase sigma factor [Kofleriaceae bacterium]
MTAGELGALVLAKLPAGVRAAGLDDRLEAGLTAIRSKWPDAPAIGDAFALYLADRIAAQADLANAMPRLRVDDLFLAWWASSGDARGVAAFEAAFAEDLRKLVTRFHRLPADELRQRLRIKLFVGDAPHVQSYSGFGFLQNWLKVTAARAFVDVARSDAAKREDDLDDRDLIGLAAPAGDPRDAHGRAEINDAVKRAFGGAVAALAPRERTFLRHAMVDQLTLDQIAATYQVHRATVARTLAAAREKLLSGTRAGVVAILGIAPDELASAIQMLDSRLELSLSRVLRE